MRMSAATLDTVVRPEALERAIWTMMSPGAIEGAKAVQSEDTAQPGDERWNN